MSPHGASKAYEPSGLIRLELVKQSMRPQAKQASKLVKRMSLEGSYALRREGSYSST
jgi:hypothetical protein